MPWIDVGVIVGTDVSGEGCSRAGENKSQEGERGGPIPCHINAPCRIVSALLRSAQSPVSTLVIVQLQLVVAYEYAREIELGADALFPVHQADATS